MSGTTGTNGPTHTGQDTAHANLVAKRITFATDPGEVVTNVPLIDGRPIIRFGHDAVHIEPHPALVEVIENTLTPGGSMRAPTLSGRLVIRARLSPALRVMWGGLSRVIIEDDPATTLAEAAHAARREVSDTGWARPIDPLDGMTSDALRALLAQALADSLLAKGLSAEDVAAITTDIREQVADLVARVTNLYNVVVLDDA